MNGRSQGITGVKSNCTTAMQGVLRVIHLILQFYKRSLEITITVAIKLCMLS